MMDKFRLGYAAFSTLGGLKPLKPLIYLNPVSNIQIEHSSLKFKSEVR